ncbi:squamosa promoter binding [Micractinium conductrix]|uniref:Squamosa promoter binding n=1 Tax=Micractinium conductrix TaxID=554055 RepID=A0A2P6V2Y8_9CHLO|nr:squamosa promoter binding [Micractinium conductrix]|eukprot:PSC68456.1 squamosa promoter binding [Micractinium conductrix]
MQAFPAPPEGSCGLAAAPAAGLAASDSRHSSQTLGDAQGPGGAPAAAQDPPAKRRPGRPPRDKCCQVCHVVLAVDCPSYFRRYRICSIHRDALSVMLAEQEQRFCQQCGTFHPLAKFAGTRRSCRDRLRKHAIRRRKTADTSRPSSWQWSEGEQEEEEEEEGSEESQRGAAEGTARRPSRSPTKRRKPGPERAGSGGSEQLPAVAPPQAATPALAVPPLLLLQPPLLQLAVQQQRALRPATPPAAAAAAANAWPWQAAWLGAEQQAAAAKPAPSPVPPRRPAIDASPGDAMAALLAAAEAEEQEEEQQRHCHRVQAAAASAAWSPAAASAAMPAGHLHQLQHQQQQDHLSSILAAFGPAAPQQQAPAPHAFIQLLAGGGGGGGSGMFGPAAAAPAAQVLLQALLSSGGLPGLCAAPAHLAGALAALQAQQAQQQVQAQLAAVCQLVLQQQLAGKAGVPPTKAQQAQPVVRPLAHHVKAEPAAAAPAGASAASPAHEHQQQTAGPHVAQPLAAVPPAAPVAA